MYADPTVGSVVIQRGNSIMSCTEEAQVEFRRKEGVFVLELKKSEIEAHDDATHKVLEGAVEEAIGLGYPLILNFSGVQSLSARTICLFMELSRRIQRSPIRWVVICGGGRVKTALTTGALKNQVTILDSHEEALAFVHL